MIGLFLNMCALFSTYSHSLFIHYGVMRPIQINTRMSVRLLDIALSTHPPQKKSPLCDDRIQLEH
jgi:hypothetical protein